MSKGRHRHPLRSSQKNLHIITASLALSAHPPDSVELDPIVDLELVVHGFAELLLAISPKSDGALLGSIVVHPDNGSSDGFTPAWTVARAGPLHRC